MKKKSAFIITALFCTLLTGCGNQNTNQDVLTAKEFYAECEIDRETIENINDKLDVIIANQTSLAESMKEQEVPISTGTQEIPDTSSEQEVPTPTATPSVKTDNSVLAVSILYNNELLAVPLSTSSKFSPFELTYPGHADRDLSIIVSGAISHINSIDENGYYLATLPVLSDKINNLNYLYFYMDNDGINGAKFYFEIVTTDNQNYYFGVDYHN